MRRATTVCVERVRALVASGDGHVQSGTVVQDRCSVRPRCACATVRLVGIRGCGMCLSNRVRCISLALSIETRKCKLSVFCVHADFGHEPVRMIHEPRCVNELEVHVHSRSLAAAGHVFMKQAPFMKNHEPNSMNSRALVRVRVPTNISHHPLSPHSLTPCHSLTRMLPTAGARGDPGTSARAHQITRRGCCLSHRWFRTSDVRLRHRHVSQLDRQLHVRGDSIELQHILGRVYYVV